MDPLTTDQWVLWLPTAVTLATLSMEGVPGLVKVMGPGVGQLQPVKVRGGDKWLVNTYLVLHIEGFYTAWSDYT